MKATSKYITERGIPFRDIKVSNIILSWQFTAFISHANLSTKATESYLKTSTENVA
jgi:hypothetical protein